MKKLAILAAAAALTVAGAAFAADQADLNADGTAVVKDQSAINRDHSNMAYNRAAKAKAKATGNVGDQAATSADLAANHIAVGEKKAEKSIDNTIMNNDAKDSQ